jgi:Transcriptional regulator PadR-like family
MIPYGNHIGDQAMGGNKADIWLGTLALMVLKTLESMGPLHGYGIARRIEQTSGDLFSLNYGTLYPTLLKEGTGRSDSIRMGIVRKQSQG